MRILLSTFILILSISVNSEGWERTYEFSVSDQNFSVILSMPDEEINNCLSEIKNWQKKNGSFHNGGNFDPRRYLKFPCSEDLVRSLNLQLHEIYKQNFETREDEVLLFMSFVNSIPYKREPDEYGKVDYWQFPLQTLHLNSGDCEDHAFLLANLFYRNGYKSILIQTANHMACAVDATVVETNYYDPAILRYQNDKYYYCEPGGSSASPRKIGEVGVSSGCTPIQIDFVEPQDQFDRFKEKREKILSKLESAPEPIFGVRVEGQNGIYNEKVEDPEYPNDRVIMDHFNERSIFRGESQSPFNYERRP